MNVPLVVIIVALAYVFAMESRGIVDVSAERLAFFFGLFVAVPAGISSLIVGLRAIRHRTMQRFVAIAGIVLGLINLVAGVLAWVWFISVQLFVSAFS